MGEKRLLLDIQDLRTHFRTDDGIIKAVDGITFQVNRGETLGIVGESGCGKSVTSLSIMNLIPEGTITSGQIIYHKSENEQIEITKLEPHSTAMRRIRGNELAMIFQEPMTSLNPVYTIGEQIMEAVRLHLKADRQRARQRALEMLELVGISAPGQRVNEYPHQLSGGMRQRAMIAMALSCSPNCLIADEPTTALDVTIEAQILQLMRRLQKELGMAIIIITHDLGVIGTMAERVIVMYTGKVVEQATTDDIFYNPKHPYTKGLLNSIPQIGRKERLIPIKGTVPNMTALPPGCYFAPRCPEAKDICHREEPAVYDVGNTHTVKCWLYDQGEGRLA